MERAEKERQERLEREEKEQQERLEKKERQERLEREEKQRQERLEEKEWQEWLDEKRLALQHELEEEKLLPSNNESINLLQYISDFRTKPFRACESAGANLSSSQKSMKKKYDLDAVEHNFKPGQKVLVLLPVPGNPLRVNVSKNQRNCGHSSKFSFAHTLSIGRP